MPAMSKALIRLAVTFVAAGALSCQSNGRARDYAGGSVRRLSRTAGHSRDMLTAAELVEHPTLVGGSLFDAIIGLRPEFLVMTQFGSNRLTRGQPTVIVDGSSRGGLDALRSINASAVASVSLVRPGDALVRYGQGYPAGVIVVTSVSSSR